MLLVAEWTQPPPGLIGSEKKDDDPIESFSGSPPFYHQQQITDCNMQVAPDISKNSSQFPLAPIVEDDDEIQISSALSAVSLGNQKGSDKSVDKIDASKGNKLTRQHPYLRSNDRYVNQEHKDLSQVSTGSTIDQLLLLGGHQRSLKNALGQSTSGDRRSKSADWNSACASKKSKKLASSKSCPPSRLRLSPRKEVFKVATKVDRSDRASNRKVDGNEAFGNPAIKTTSGRKPLIRRAGQTNMISSFFAKPVEVPVPMEIEDDLQKEPNQTQDDIVDVEDAEQQEKIRERAKAVAKVQDASTKWLANIDADTRNTVENTAVQILLSMHATFCYYVVAMRLLTKAPWTENMVSIDVRQAALVAISEGWYLHSNNCGSFPFSPAELAIAAGLYVRVLLNRLLKMMLHMDSKSSLTIYHKSAIFSSRKLKLIAQHVVLRQLGLFIYCQLLSLGLIMGGLRLKTLSSMRNPSLVEQKGLGMHLSVNIRRLLSLLTSLVDGYTWSSDP